MIIIFSLNTDVLYLLQKINKCMRKYDFGYKGSPWPV